MQCHQPYIPPMHPDVPAPCRGCMACKVNHKRLWQHRIILELKAHEKASFITLTYDDENLPQSGSVSIPEVQRFNKRLRKQFHPRRLRFFAVGEYGDQSWRPHYHFAYFGLACEFSGQCNNRKRTLIQRNQKKYCTEIIDQSWYIDQICDTCQKIEKAWDRGFVDVSELNSTTAGYISGYCTKKMTKDTDPRLLRGDNIYLHPEFSTQSQNLGLPGLKIILDEWKKNPHFENFLTETGDVPYSLTHDGKSYPIGRHLREKARHYLQLEEAYDEETGEIKFVSKEAQKILQKEDLQIMREDEKISKDAKVSLKFLMKEKNYQRNKNIEKRSKIYKKEKLL